MKFEMKNFKPFFLPPLCCSCCCKRLPQNISSFSSSSPPSSVAPTPQGSQDSTGGQEGLVAPPFATFPPPPPPQNGLPGTEFVPGAMFGTGGQGTAEVGVGTNGAPTTTNNNVSSLQSERPFYHLVSFNMMFEHTDLFFECTFFLRTFFVTLFNTL